MYLIAALLISIIICLCLQNNKEGFCSTFDYINPRNQQAPNEHDHPWDPNLIYPETATDPTIIKTPGGKELRQWSRGRFDGYTTRPYFPPENKFHRIGVLYTLKNPHYGMPLFGEKMFNDKTYVHFYFDPSVKQFIQIKLPNVLRNGDQVYIPEKSQDPFYIMVYKDNLNPMRGAKIFNQ